MIVIVIFKLHVSVSISEMFQIGPFDCRPKKSISAEKEYKIKWQLTKRDPFMKMENIKSLYYLAFNWTVLHTI